MPGRDGTGPVGRGPLSGRGMGRCGESAGAVIGGFGNGRRGFGRRIRGGFGPWWQGSPAEDVRNLRNVDAASQIETLRAEAMQLNEAIAEVMDRIGDMEARQDSDKEGLDKA